MDTQIVHAVEGRIRIRVPLLAKDEEYTSQLQKLLASLNFVTNVRMNPLAESIVVTYRYKGVSVDVMQTSIQTAIAQLTDPQSSSVPPTPEPTITQVVTPESPSANHGVELTGEVLGGTVGGIIGETVGGVMAGPLGMVVGEEVGTFVGSILGEDIVKEVEHIKYSQPDIPAEIEVSASETVGGKIGETVGEIIGDVLLGEEGGAIGKEIGEKIASTVTEILSEEASSKN